VRAGTPTLHRGNVTRSRHTPVETRHAWSAHSLSFGCGGTRDSRRGLRSVCGGGQAVFMAVVSTMAAGGFVLYGGRLFMMLRRFPVQSPGRRKKLKEVGCVTSICTTCFTARALVIAYSAFNDSLAIDVLGHPVMNLVYYVSVEILPSALVLFILRKLPPKRPKNGYQPIS
jgi:hypothetical protein